MKKIYLLTLVISFSIILLISCKTTTESKTNDSTPTEQIVVTFDENGITVSGVSVLPTGKHSFILNNLYDLNQVLYLVLCDEGYTYQHLIDLQSEPGVWWPKPTWCSYVKLWDEEWIEEGKSVYTFNLDTKGDYIIFTYSENPRSLWLGGPLRIE